ncbi:LysE/ArgO family amino acid transporter [Aromatoleum evansii]|uniref:LysE/ArgO family amino acid transporter n=1 Tax=Aromatoleum evansii TaxID=59406 RepID=A0ABZ1AHJ1_AROEV|nr:LysE/ArgO family amino acid transporter [Aromatoleum evansii]NMG28556.1 LysE family transporter [Aromatoleum evansii]WRL45330.1 LysE/ArgO family amino acid transporter [Aromatoleum evansii]
MDTRFLAGFLASMALIVAIGAQNSFVLRQGIRREHLLPVALICALSDALLIGAGIAGLGALIQSSPDLLAIARYGGAAFLVMYGGFAARRAWQGERMHVEAGAPVPLATAVATCLGFTFLNPHVYLDTVVLLGGLANQHGEHGRWVFGAGSAAASLLWFFTLAYGARVLAPLFARAIAWRVLDALMALVMFALAASLLQGEGVAAMIPMGG